VSVTHKASTELAEEVVRSFGEVWLRVLGTSMAPSILPGDLVFVQRAGLDEISLGEIVLFSRDDRWFAHRVVSRGSAPKSSCLITRGDRLGQDDPPVMPSQLIGRVVSIQRGRRQFAPSTEVRGWKRLILSVLRVSDLATYAYLRLLSWARELLPEGTTCRL
jgi:signal peptidase I